MSETIEFDRRKGFVALPVEVLELELSPGAFRLLVELCRMANMDGFCWPSLGQLGERLGRSKAAISGYVTALREAELISTETQTTANGYNYRLRYCVVFWKAWRASLSGKVAASCTEKVDHKDECSVQKSERLRDSKKQIHIKHDPCGLSVHAKLISEWAECTKGTPYPALKHTPSEGLVAATNRCVQDTDTTIELMSADIRSALERTFSAVDLDKDRVAVTAAVDHLAEKGLSRPELNAFCAALTKSWQRHWRKVPTPKQLDQTLKSAAIIPYRAQLKLLEGYLRRWTLAQKTLRPAPPCEKLPVRIGAPALSGTPTYIRGYN
ncbi:helix-turn-helix domain-containing protein [uncultured Tateyamaria sp.]|uniref:helix-turn-helix domain-containing protein n=1 Tax=uncultured Tateyamaria sp. TaxID=455651 RepID=UPI00261FA2A0|nr:helix-turn-helix domain-containing protein [uncultured Tateyamaria sp.]